MSQHDFEITTADANTGLTIRAAINAALQALASCSSGAAEPGVTYPYQLWADTTTGSLKIRNAANTAWVSVLTLSTGYPISASLAALAGLTGVAGKVPYFTSATEMALASLFVDAGTKMYFYQNTAPGGWTIDATCADALLAVKGGSNAFNVAGGNQAGTWTQPNHTHSFAHTHSVGANSAWVSYGTDVYGNQPVAAWNHPHAATDSQSTSTTGNGATTATYRPLAQVGIIATKD